MTVVLRNTLTILFLLGLVACGASARTKVLRVNLVVLNTARDAVLAQQDARAAAL